MSELVSPEPACIGPNQGPAIDHRVLALAQAYLHEHRLGHKTGPSLEAAWQRFFETLVPLIRSYAKACRCPDAYLDDGVQEVYVVLMLHLPNYPSGMIGGHFQGWLYVVVRNTVRNWLGCECRHRCEQLDVDQTATLIANEPTPARYYESLEMANKLMHALEEFGTNIDPVGFRVMELHWMKGLTYKKIAEQTQLSIGQVKGHLNRSKQRLCVFLDQIGIDLIEK